MNAITPFAEPPDALAEFGRAIYPRAAVSSPGIYEITHAEYHLDPCCTPSLSCSIARKLIRQTPRHAWQAHPRFGNIGMVPSRVMDDGSAMHAMMLEQPHLIDTIRTVYGPKHKNKGEPVTDYRTAEAQEERDEIRAYGRIPVLHHRLPELLRCKAAAVQQLGEAEDGAVFLEPGRSEVCAVAREDDVLLRCLVDRLPDEPALPPGDLKCTELSAAPGGWERRLQTEYAFQDAFYQRVLRGAEGLERPPMRFGVIELDPPHGTVVMAALPDLRALAEIEVERAIQIWRRCMRANEWPRYTRQTTWIGAAAWQLARSEDADEISDAALATHIGAPATFGAVRELRAA
jgi:PDDEXK-like domain of unknown function (DUF3799)